MFNACPRETRAAPPAPALLATAVAAISIVPMLARFTVGQPRPSPSPGGAQAMAILAIDGAVGVDHEADFFNRRTILTFTYRTGVILQANRGAAAASAAPCSDVDLDDVVLVVELPGGTQYVEARQNGNPLPPSTISGGTLTWQLGTLDRSVHCFGTDLAITIEADPGLADAESLQATASISTSTLGDDPADNQASVAFPAVMFPLEVGVLSVETNCTSDKTGNTFTAQDGRGVNCGLPHAIARHTDAPGSLGLVPASGPRPFVRSIGQGVYGHAFDAIARAGVDARVRIENPNPFSVPLHLHYDAALFCRTRGGGQAEMRAAAPIIPAPSIATFAECGYGNVANMSETMFIHYRARGGPAGACETRIALFSDERNDDVIHESAPGCTLQAIGAYLNLDFDLPGEASGAVGAFNGAARWCVAASPYPCQTCVGGCSTVRIVANSPVDLLVTDEIGRRVGLVDDQNLGPFDAVEIPGSGYSGAGSEPQTISLALADPGTYTLTVLGRGDGPYTITVAAEDDDETVTQGGTLSGQAAAGMTLERAVLVGSDGRVALEPQLDLDTVVAHLLGGEASLDDAQLNFLDLLGNENEDFDVGDLRAFLVSTGAIPSQ